MSVFFINGDPTDGPPGAVAYKYADPIEGARWVFDDDEADDLEREGAPLERISER